MRLNADLTERAVVHAATLPWQPSPMPGVQRRMLERIGDEVARATSIVRYAPGSRFSAHTHDGGEEFLVLEGVFADEDGDYPAGTYVRNPVGSRHVPRSDSGCEIFVKLWQMRAADQRRVRIHIGAGRSGGPGPLTLHEAEDERVCVVDLPPGTSGRRSDYLGGAELLVLEGELSDEDDTYRKGSWLRLPPGMQHTPRSGSGARFYLKTGHLADPPPLPPSG